MSGVFRKIKEAKQFCYNSADYNRLLTSFLPPQHPFKSNVSIEEVIAKIDAIEQALSYVKDGEVESEAGKRLRSFAYNNSISSNLKRELYSIAAHMDNELNLVQNSKPQTKTPICLPLITFLESYKNNGGQLSDDLMEHIASYCSQIETQYQRLLEHEQTMYTDYVSLRRDVEKFIREESL